MKKVVCTNGHFYDADRFDSCPICGQSCGKAELKSENPPAFENEETVPLPPSSAVDELASTTWMSPDEMRALWGDDAPEKPQEEPQEEAPEALQEAVPPGQQVDELAPTMWIAPDLENSPEPAENGEETPENDVAPLPEEDTQPQMTLAQAVAASDAVGISPVPQAAQEAAAQPVPDFLPVGWLVGLSGSVRGKIFPCKPGRNRIGREPQMDIALPEESSVDLAGHAQVIYEPKKRQFFIQAGSGNGLSYLNHELVFTHGELHAYDRITLGEAEFLFLPLCGECFDWDTNTCEE